MTANPVPCRPSQSSKITSIGISTLVLTLAKFSRSGRRSMRVPTNLPFVVVLLQLTKVKGGTKLVRLLQTSVKTILTSLKVSCCKQESYTLLT